jgi:hypothetical protein
MCLLHLLILITIIVRVYLNVMGLARCFPSLHICVLVPMVLYN